MLLKSVKNCKLKRQNLRKLKLHNIEKPVKLKHYHRLQVAVFWNQQLGRFYSCLPLA